MANSNRGLGKGFGSLIPTGFDTNILVDESERIQKLSVDALEPNPEQPRSIFDEKALAGLAQSIKQHGILQPLVVTPHDDRYYIIAGERRWRAAQIAGLETVPAVVRTSKQLERLELALIENVQRVDLSPLEQAVSIERLHQQFNMSYEDIGKRLGKAGTTVVNTVRLLQLPDDARQALESGKISEGHARQVLSLKGKRKAQTDLLNLIIKHGWSVRQAERYVISLKQGVEDREKVLKRVDTESPATKALSKRLGTPVAVRRTARGGRLEISFKDEDQLAALIDSLSKL